MSDCVPSPSSDSSYGPSSGSNSSSDSSSSPSCEISLVERLIRTHPVWFLPSLQRSGALHLLQGRETGNFIVRSSTQPLTMAVSVKLPGNHVEHYLLKAVDNRIALENSTHTFETVHQLIAHYCILSDEIPVCLRVPNSIAEATTRQQLRSLALLGQEFWTRGTGKELSSPSDAEISKNFISSGLGSQSSSSQNSLCDLRKPCRPTTLELSALVSGGSGTPPPVPPRWSRSNLLTPMSLPSSVQSTPSEVQSTFSEKSGRIGKKKKRHSGSGKPESIHYKDTEILALFKGTKTNYDDKASDYEDIWSPQYSGKSQSQTPQGPPRLSTFKPDLIASSLGSEDSLYTQNKLEFQVIPNNNSNNNERNAVFTVTQINNKKNNRLSFNGTHVRQLTNQNEMTKEKASSDTTSVCTNGNINDESRTKKSSLYSEPVDSITFRRFGNYRHSEPNIRWSQPTMMSLVSLDPDFTPEKIGRPKKQTLDSGTASTCRSNKMKDFPRGSLANVSVSNGIIPKITNVGGKGQNRNSQVVSCASVDNLCHLREFKRKLSCGVSGDKTDEDDDGKEEENQTQTIIVTNTLPKQPPIVKPQPAPRKKSTDVMVQKEREKERDILNISNNQSWRLDNSWEFVMWEKGEGMVDGSSMKFPVTSPLISPNNNSTANLIHEHQLYKKSEEVLDDPIIYGRTYSHRFSRYDNLESREDCEESGSVDGGDETSDADKDEKISTPWDSSKWEHLLRLVSESTQQLDSLQLNENGPHERHNKNLFQGDEPKEDRDRRLLAESKQRISKILEVSGNVDKASRVISSVVRNLAEKDNGFFGPTLKSFITCTISAKIQDPYKVMRNIRQFISGMKNYLVGVSLESAELRVEIKKQTELLSDCEFLNIDAILEDILVDLVISPLNSHIRGLIEVHHSSIDSHLRTTDSLTSSFLFTTTTKDSQRQEIQEKLKKIILGFEENISPIKKLDKWNEFVCQVQELENYSSESFLPLLAEMLRCVCSSNLPSDVDYMIGLLPHSLAEQNNYSLSLLQSAVSSLRSKPDRKGSFTLTSVRVIVPDERNGTLIRKMVPIRETTTTKEVAKMVASKVGIANLGDYVLVRIKNGEEKLCPDGELVSKFLEDSQTALAYKRVDAKIGWPQRIS